VTSSVLAIHGALSVIFGPIIGHYSDRNPNQRLLLLISLGICIVGTCIVTVTRSVLVLLLGRVIQSIAGSAVWIIGFATVADNISSNNIDLAIGLVMSFANSGTISGPAISGLLYEVVSYWALWSIPLLVLVIDLITCILMIDCSSEITSNNSHTSELNMPLLLREDPASSSAWGI
jgi:MFS family permease